MIIKSVGADVEIPNVSMQGFTAVNNAAYPGSWNDFVFLWADNVTKVTGNHAFKVGASIERSGMNDRIQLSFAQAPATTNQNGSFRFTDTRLGAPTSGLSAANTLLGLFDDPEYIRGAGTDTKQPRQNVAALAASVSASLLAQFISLTIAPGGVGAPAPLRYALSTHTLEHLTAKSRPNCPFESMAAVGDRRIPITGDHLAARAIQASRAARQSRFSTRLRRALADQLDRTLIT